MKNKKENLILLADAYKYSHHKLYTPGTTKIYSYLESRGGKFDEIVFYGLQYFLQEYLEGEVFTKEDVDEAEIMMNQIFGRTDVFDRSIFDYIIDTYGGNLPIIIKAVEEGTVVQVNNVLMTIENIDPKCFWLTNFLETLLMQIWYPITVATLSREIKKVVTKYFELTASAESQTDIDFVLNDFGFRGVSSVESAGLGGSAHLINFQGSDTVMGSVYASRYYNYGVKRAYGLSVPATEHSIMTLLGEEGEELALKHLLDTYPTGIIACVSDSYNIFRACEEYWGTSLKEQILSRDGVLVIRPDSGEPIPTLLKIFEILFNKFDFVINEKGYKVLPPQIRVIQGDGVNYEAICDIYEALKANGISAENLVLGMGGALLQKLDRDTQKFAIKCSYAEVNGQAVEVKKSPMELNDQGQLIQSFKKSKAGKLMLINSNDEKLFKTVKEEPTEFADHEMALHIDQLKVVFKNGSSLRYQTFDDIRNNAKIK